MNTFHEDISKTHEQCGKSAQVDCCAWIVGGKMMRTKSGDPINDRIVELAREEARQI